MASIKCIVVTPEATALEQEADFIALPLFDGELGVDVGHSPLIGRLGLGELRLKTGGNISRYYIDGGFVQIADDVVSILTEAAVPAAELNVAEEERRLAEAQEQAADSPERFEQRKRAVNQARARLRIAFRA